MYYIYPYFKDNNSNLFHDSNIHEDYLLIKYYKILVYVLCSSIKTLGLACFSTNEPERKIDDDLRL